MILDDLVILVDAGVAALTDGTNLFAAELPDGPDEAVVIQEYAGGPPVEAMGLDLEAAEVYAIQVLTRSTTTPMGRLLAHQVHRVVRGINPATTMDSGITYISSLPNQMPYPMRVDDDDRPYYVCNYTIYRDTPVTLT